MIYVIARNAADVETWRLCAGLPRSHVTYLSSDNAVRGRRLEQHEVIRLECAYMNPRLDDLMIALAPCGIQVSKIPTVSILP